jgi:hypothetical protein
MRRMFVKKLDYDLTPVAGLTLVGHYLNTPQSHRRGHWASDI